MLLTSLNLELITESLSSMNGTFDELNICDVENDDLKTAMSKSLTYLNETVTDLVRDCDTGYQIMSEATINYAMNKIDENTLYVINENVFGSIFNRVKGFFRACYEIIKNFVNKIKQDVKLTTKDNEKWLDAITPMLDSKNENDRSKFKYTGAPWKIKSITKEEPEAFLNKEAFKANPLDQFSESTNDVFEFTRKLAEAGEGAKEQIDAYRKMIYGSPGSKNIDTEFDESKFYEKICGTKDMDKFRNNFSKNVKGDSAKREITGFSEITSTEMLETIKKLSDFKEKANKKMETLKQNQSKIITKLEASESKVKEYSGEKFKDQFKKFEDNPKLRDSFVEDSKTAREEYLKVIGELIKETKIYLNIGITGYTDAISLGEEQCKEYKRYLTTFAKTKSKK